MIDIKKIKDLFVETPVFDDRNKDYLSSDRIFSTKKGKFVKTEKINQELEADIYDVEHYDYYSIMVRKNQDTIGMMEIDYAINEKVPFPRMMAVAIKPIYRGKGYSKVLYDWVIDKFGGIISDDSLTGEDGHGSFNLWQYLSKKYPTYIFRASQSIIIPIKGMITPDLMDNKNDRFMCTKAPFDYESYNKQSAHKAVVPKYVTRQQGKLEEMPSFSDSNLVMGKKGTNDDEFNRTAYQVAGEKVNEKLLRNGIKLEMFESKNGPQHVYELFAFDGDEIVGRVKANTKVDAEPNFPYMDFSYVYERYQGKGIATAMYEMIVDFAGGLYSDRTLTGREEGGSFSLWQKLATMYHAYLKKRVGYSGKILYKITPVKQFDRDMMGAADDRFLITADPLPIEGSKTQDRNLVSVNETPQFNDKDKALGDNPENFEAPSHSTLVGTYPVKMGNGTGSISLYQFKSNKASKAITLDTPDAQTVGNMFFDAPTDSDVPFPTVVFTAIRSDQRGKGFSKILYDFVINKYKGLISDATLTGEFGPGSFQTWESLGKKYKPYMINTMNGEAKPVAGFDKKMMGNHAERFMVSQHPFDTKQHNAKMGLKEVELMQHKGENDIDSSDPNEWDFSSGQKLIEKKVGNGIIFLKMKIAHASDVKYALKDAKTGKIISGMRAKIDPSDYKVSPNEAQISSVVTGEQYRNKGWGKLLYKLVLDAEKTIVSDYQLYPGAAAIWSKYLPTIANVYNYNEDGELEPFDFAKGTSKEGIYDYFVASKKKLL